MRVHDKTILTPGQLGLIAKGSTKGKPPPHKLLQHPELETVYEELIDGYSGTGVIDWKTALREHPEWERALRKVPWPTRYSRARFILNKRRRASGQKTISQRATNHGSKWTLAQELLRNGKPVQEIAEILTEKFGGLPHSNQTYLYKLRSKMRQTAEPEHPPAPPGNPAALVVRPRPTLKTVMNQVAQGSAGGVIHCPTCGEHIGLWQQVYEIVKNLKGQP